MSERDNDSISNFFQKAAKEPQIDFSESDWLKLEARLDAHAMAMGGNGTNRWKIIIASLVILLPVFYVAYVFRPVGNQNDPKQIVRKFNVNPNSKNNDNLPSDSSVGTVSTYQQSVVLLPNHELRSAVSQVLERSNKKTDSVYQWTTDTAANSKKKSNQVNTILSLNEFSADRAKQKSEGTKTDTPEGTPNDNEAIVDTALVENKQSIEPKKATLTRLKNNDDQLILEEGIVDTSFSLSDNGRYLHTEINQESIITSTPADDTLSIDDLVPFTGLADSLENKNRVKVKANADEATSSPRWSLVFSFSPDFSTTGLRQYTSPGEAFGIIAHYHLNTRLSVSTGAVRSNKRYESYGSDYKPGNGYWAKKTNGVIPTYIEGNCKVLEIPMSIQYNLIKKNKSKAFISAGISSYILLKESYRYTFENPNPGADQGWNSPSTTRFLFKIATVSGSYERSISRHMALGIEPYIKIPLSEIGWSNVKLYTIGASVTLRYSFLKLKYPERANSGTGPD